MTELNENWKRHSSETCVRVDKKVVVYDKKSFYKEDYPNIPIIKYKAKADEKMRFNKQNIERVFDKFMQGGDSVGDLKESIMNLVDDTPGKVVVPKFVAEFYEECGNTTLKFLIIHLEATDSRSVLGEWYRSCSGRHGNNRANAQEIIARMKLDGYTIEPEQLYYIPLPELQTLDGEQQMLSKRKNDTNYFASRSDEYLQQHYTQEELKCVPEVYKQYAKLIEEEEK